MSENVELFKQRRANLELFLKNKISYERLVGESTKLIKLAQKSNAIHDNFLDKLYVEYLHRLNILERRSDVEMRLIQAGLSCEKDFKRVCECHLRSMTDVVSKIFRVSGRDCVEKVFLWKGELGVIQLKNSPIGKLFVKRDFLVENTPRLARGQISSPYLDFTFSFIEVNCQKKKR